MKTKSTRMKFIKQVGSSSLLLAAGTLQTLAARRMPHPDLPAQYSII